MSRDQLQDEKLAVQKALLQHENTFGRPVSLLYFKIGSSVHVVFHNNLSWFVSELPEKDISNVVVQCR